MSFGKNLQYLRQLSKNMTQEALAEKLNVSRQTISKWEMDDINRAIEYHNLKPAGVFTSEDARAYKPRRELFELALKKTGLAPEEVIHIGDSISSDVKGASELGINTLWLNRFGKEVPEGVKNIASLLQTFELV